MTLLMHKKPFSLSWTDHLCTTVVISLGSTHIIKQINMVSMWGGSLFLLTHALAVYTIAIPLFVLETALGVITKKSFIKYWDMFPVFRGTGYCMVINLFYNTTMNICYAGLALLFFVNSFKVGLENAHCKFDAATKDCIPITSTKIFNKTCCVHQTNCKLDVPFSSYEYFKSFSYANPQNVEPTKGVIYADWLAVLVVCWVVAGVFVYFDMRRYYTIINSLVMFYGCIFIVIAISTIVVAYNLTIPSIFKTRYENLKAPEFWVEIFVHATYWERPGEFIFLGSMAKESTDPTGLALINYTIKIIVLSIAALWMSIGTHKIQEHYKVRDFACIHITGQEVAFAIVPDMISRWIVPQFFLLIWYILLAIWSMMFVIISVNANINTLTETHPVLSMYRSTVIVVYCIIGYIACCTLVNKDVVRYFQGWRNTGYFLVALTFHAVHIIAIGAYSLQRFRNDYTFYYGRSLHVLWRHVLKVALFLILVLYLVFLINFKEMKIKKNKFTPKEEVAVIAASLVTVSPLFIYIVVLIIHRKNKNVVFFTPTKEWGSPNPRKRRLRNSFFPQRTTKYDTEHIICPHSCLMYSKNLSLEAEYLREKAYHLKDLYSDQKRERILKRQQEKMENQGLDTDLDRTDKNGNFTAEQMNIIKKNEEELAKYMLEGKRKIH